MQFFSGTTLSGTILGKGLKYMMRTLLLLICSSIMVFMLLIYAPVDPVQQYIVRMGATVSPERKEALADYFGVNEAPVTRYVSWLNKVLQGDMGESLLYRQPVSEVIKERAAASAALMLCAWLFSGITGFVLACVSGLYAGSRLDGGVKKLCCLLSSLPNFWVALLLLMLFGVYLKWFPTGFSGPIGVVSSEVGLLQRLQHLILPALTLSLLSCGNIALHTRSKLIEVLKSDYILFAKARGASLRQLLSAHCLRNIALPAITLQLTSIGELFGGSLIAETVFSYPGLGSAAAQAGLNSDLPLLLGITLFSVVLVSAGNFSADLLYLCFDPRLRGAQ